MPEPDQLPPIPENPYVGPHPYATGQILHGRRRETSALADLLVSKRIALLISPSGAGKTSLIQAALLPRLAPDLAALPAVRLDRLYDDTPEGANRYLISALHCLETRFPPQQRLDPDALGNHDLETYLAERTADARGADDAAFRLLIIDQFEELFTLDRSDWADKEEFLRQLGQALRGGARGSEAESPLWALLAMREDYVAELEPYLDLIPTGLAFRYRLEPLKREQAIEAAMAPSAGYFPREAAERLAENLTSLQEGEGAPRRQGRFIEPVQLQVVCLRLWERIVAAEQRPITAADIAGAASGGEVASALTEYYDSVMDEAAEAGGVPRRELMDWLESRLISSNKVRTRLLREPGHWDAACRILVDRHLLRLDITGEREWIELAHDRLVDPVLNGNQAWREAHLELFQRQAKLWSESARPDEMLFSGERLDSALRYAGEHPGDLTGYDRDFLERSKAARRQAEQERERVRQIEAKNAEIKRKNHRLRAQRFWISALGILSLITLVGVAATLVVIDGQKTALQVSEAELTSRNQEIEARNREIEARNQEIETKNRALEGSKLRLGFAQANGWARGGDPARALPGLLQVARTIESNRHLGQVPELDQRLIQVLGGHPPIERVLERDGSTIRALRFTADGKRLFSVGFDDKVTLRSMDGDGSGPGWSFPLSSNVYGLAYHPGRELMACTDSSGNVALWDVSGETPGGLVKLNQDHRFHRSRVAAAAFSPDGRWLATAGRRARIQLWDISDPAHPKPGPRLGKGFHQSEVYRLAFIEHGPYAGHLVSGDWTGRIGLWKVTGEAVDRPVHRLLARTAGGGKAAVYSLAVSPNGRWIVAGDHVGGILSWDLAPDEPVQRRLTSSRSHWGAVFDLAFSTDGARLVSVGADSALLIWSFPIDAKDERSFYADLAARRVVNWGEKLYSLAFVPGSSNRIALGGTRKVWLVDIERPNLLAAPVESKMSTTDWPALAATPELDTIAALAQDHKTLRIWRRHGQSYRPALASIHTENRVDKIALAPDGSTLVALDCGRRIDIWRIPSETSEANGPSEAAPHLIRGPNWGCALAFSPADKLFAVTNGDELILWTQSTAGWEIADRRVVSGKLGALAFSPDGTQLVAAGNPKHILQWTIESGRLADEPRKSESPTESAIVALAYAPDGGSLISAGKDLSVAQWRLPELAREFESNRHFRTPTSIALGIDAGEPISISGDVDGQLVVCMQPVSDTRCSLIGTPVWGRIDAVAVSSDFERMVVSNRGLWIWDLRRESMLETARRLAPRNAPARRLE